MTVAAYTSAIIEYVGNGASSVFPITFPTFEDENIEVEVADEDGNTTALDLSTHFTLLNIGKPGVNGSVTLVNGAFDWQDAGGDLLTGWTLYVKFAANVSQPMKGRDWGQFAPERFERTLDRLAMNIAAVKVIAEKAVGFQTGDGAEVTLPTLSGNALKIIQVNATEDGLEYGVTSTTILGYQTAAQTAATAAAASQVAAAASQVAAAASASGASASQVAAVAAAASANISSSNASGYATSAGVSQTSSATSASNSSNSALAASVSATAAATSATAAAASATAASTAEGFRDQAEVFKNQAQTAKTAAELAETNAETAEVNAELAETNAETAEVNAQAAAVISSLFADDSETAAEQSELFANLSVYTNRIEIGVTDSPYTIDDDLHEDTLIVCDVSGGDIILNLPPISDTFDQATWKVGVIKKAPSINVITINRFGTNTINGNTSMDVEDDVGALIYPRTPTDWNGKLFVSTVTVEPGSDDSIINALIFG